MSQEIVEISRSAQIKCTNLEKFKQINSEEFEKILHLTNKKPILAPKIDRRKMSYSKTEISPDQSQLDVCFTQKVTSSTRNSLVKNICSFLENKIQENLNTDLKNSSFRKDELTSTDLSSLSSVNDIYNAKISISLNSLDYSIKCRQFDAFEKSKNNNNNNEEDKKDDKAKSKSKDRHKDKEKSKKSKTDDTERRKRSKSEEKKRSRRSHSKIGEQDNNEKKVKAGEHKEEVKSSPYLQVESEADQYINQVETENVPQVVANELELPVIEPELPDEQIEKPEDSGNDQEQEQWQEQQQEQWQEQEQEQWQEQEQEQWQEQEQAEELEQEQGEELEQEQEEELEQEQGEGQLQEEVIENSEIVQDDISNIEVLEVNDPSEILNQARLSNVTSSFTDFKNSLSFSTSSKKQEDNLKQNLPIQTATKVLQYLSSFINVTTPENKNLWLSLIEKTGDSIIDILTMKDEENRNIWLTWLKDQCSSLDQLSKDLINDIEAKIMKIEYKNF